MIKNEEVYYVDNVTGNEMKVEYLRNGNTLELGGPNDRDLEYLMLTIAYPLQKKTVDGALTIHDVVLDRLQNDKNRPINVPGVSLNSIVKEFTKDHKVEISRCRLRACLYMDETDNCKVAEAISETINNTRDKNFGNFQVAMMSEPHFSCSKGGWKPFLVSKSKVGKTGFSPIFVFADSPTDENPRKVEELFRNFNQISMMKSDSEETILHDSTFVFKIPQQNPDVICAIKQYHQKIYITLFRENDQKFATDMIRFDYEVCDESEEDCAFCVMSSKFQTIGTNFGTKKNGYGRKRLRNDSAYSTTTSMVASPMSVPAVSPRHVQEENPFPLSEEETQQLLNSLGVQPSHNQPPIDLGFGEISSNPTLNLFDLEMDGSKISHDGGQQEIVKDCEDTSDESSSSSSSDDTSDEDSDDEDSEVFYLCKDTNKLKV